MERTMNLTDQFLDNCRKTGDPVADKLIEQLYAEQNQQHLYRILQTPIEDVRDIKNLPSYLNDFLRHRKPLPQWYDAKRIRSAQKFYRKYALEIMMLLGAMSLPYCYAATPGNKAIFLTEKIRNKTGKRLLETAQYVIALMEYDSFAEHGPGWTWIQKTRLIHSMVRFMLLSKNKWDHSWGVPINQEDMAGTNLAFSYIILLGLEKQKFRISADEKEDFLYIWRHIGYQMDIDEQLLPQNSEQAEQLKERIVARNFNYSYEGVTLTQDLLKHYRDAFPKIASYLVESQIRYFLGEEVSDLLELKSSKFKDKMIHYMNSFKNNINSLNLHVPTYKIMIKDHERLKNIYGA